MPRRRLIGYSDAVVATALVVTCLDALSKAWARRVLSAHPIHVAGLVWLRLSYNQGMSFSFSGLGGLTGIVTLLVAIGLVLVALRARPGVPAIGFGLLIGGGVANVIDRWAARPHEVTDFVALGSFPVFNLADVAITIGFLVLVIAALSGERLLT